MSQNLQKFAKLQKFQLDNLVDFEKCCKTRIFLQKSVPLQPKTSEIVPKIGNWKVSVDGHLPERLAPDGAAVVARLAQQVTDTSHLEVRHGLAKVAKLAIFPEFCKFLAGSFSAVSKRNFARKYAFDSIFQALQDLHTSEPLQSQHFRKK